MQQNFRLMKYSIFLLISFLLFACQSNTTKSPEQEPPVTPAKSPVPYSTKSPELLKNFVRKTLRTELDFTFPESHGTLQAKKSYSFDIEENDGRPTWVLKEKYHDLSDKLYAGAEYLMLWETVDVNSIQIIYSEDKKKTAIRISPTEGDSFMYRPYSNDPDVAVQGVTIGWYDRNQDAALLRAYTYLKQLAENMDKW